MKNSFQWKIVLFNFFINLFFELVILLSIEFTKD